jgi:phospholipid/cholesterol/gamma-HCH transport system ATP-binding protein
MAEENAPIKIAVDGLTVGFGDQVIQQNLSFTIAAGSIFAIMGGSGCGKSTLLKSMIGLLPPRAGTIHLDGVNYWALSEAGRADMGQKFGVLFQSGALWSSLTTAENIALPMRLLTKMDKKSISDLVRVKLALVGLAGSGDMMPADLSGGMRKRAGLARALALDPDILFFDEPSAGLDPPSARRLDDLIRELRDGFGSTIVLVSHELESLFAICDDGIFLDADSKTAIARGAPAVLRDHCDNPIVHAFMNRARVPDPPPTFRPSA